MDHLSFNHAISENSICDDPTEDSSLSSDFGSMKKKTFDMIENRQHKSNVILLFGIQSAHKSAKDCVYEKRVLSSTNHASAPLDINGKKTRL